MSYHKTLRIVRSEIVVMHSDSPVLGRTLETRHTHLSSFFLTSLFLEILLRMNLRLSNVAVLVSVHHLEVGVKENSPGQEQKRAVQIFCRGSMIMTQLSHPVVTEL